MKVKKIKMILVLIIISTFFIISLEPIMGRNYNQIESTDITSKPNWIDIAIEEDVFPDIIVSQCRSSGKIHLLLGNGTGNFNLFKSFSIDGEYPTNMVSNDFNNDGLLDVAVPWSIFPDSYAISVFLGEGYGLLSEPVNYPLTTFNDGITSGDFNNDGNIDLAALCHWSYNSNSLLEIFLGYGNGSFMPRWTLELPKKSGYRLVSDDFNDDSNLDLAIQSSYIFGENYLTIVLGDGAGQFIVDESYDTGGLYLEANMSCCDFNLDGFVDIAIPNWEDDDVSVFYNDGNGKFANRQDYPIGINPKATAFGDFNMDNYPDLAVTLVEKVSILINDEMGGFESPVHYDVGKSYQGNELVVYDFDGDDFQDLVITNYEDDDVTFYHGYGNGTFGERIDIYAANTPIGIVVGNFNPILIPDLNCEGDFNWPEVVPGSTLNDSFSIENKGVIKSYLNWKIDTYPEWGEWIISPLNGSDLTPEDGMVTINVSVVAPDEKNKQFSGKIKVVNIEDENDFCEIDIYLETPRIKPSPIDILLKYILKIFPNLFPLLQNLFI